MFVLLSTLQISQRHCTLTVKNAEKEDGAIYRLTLENNLGSDSANCDFTVNGNNLQLQYNLVKHNTFAFF